MPVGAAIGAVGSIGSALIGSSAAKSAADTQAQAAQSAIQAQTQAANNSLDFQKQVYSTNQTNLAPYMANGTNAMYSLASLYGLPTPGNPSSGGGAAGVNAAYQAFTQLPAYQFPFEQGSLALERQLNSQGRQMSGAQMRESQQFGQGLASQYLMSNYVNPLMSMAGQGQGAASSLAGANNATGSNVAGTYSNLATNLGQSYGNLGTAQASGIVGSANAMMGGINNLSMYSALGMGGGGTYSLSNIGNMPATGAGSPNALQSNMYAMSQGINPYG